MTGVAKNHFWKQFENTCARDFGGAGRFPANQGGALDFETPYAIGQCKTMEARRITGKAEQIGKRGKVLKRLVVIRTKKKQVSYTIGDLFKWVRAVDLSGRLTTERREKWPVVCVKVRRGAGMRSETLFCLSKESAGEWIGTARALYAPYDATVNGMTLDALTTFIETMAREKSALIGARVFWSGYELVAMGRTRFLESYAFKRVD